MLRIVYFLCVSVFLLSGLFIPMVQANDKQKIIVASEHWPGYTEADGSGIYNLMVTSVFARDKYDINFELVTYADSVIMYRRGLADIVLGVYPDEIPYATYPKTHIDVDAVVAVFKGNSTDFKLNDLAGKRLAWIRDYNYNNYFPQLNSFVELDGRETAFELLVGDKIDIFIDYQSETFRNFGDLELKYGLTNSTIGYLKTYPVFQPGNAGKKLAALWDKKMRHLIEKQYFRNHFSNTPSQLYPFDKDVLEAVAEKENE